MGEGLALYAGAGFGAWLAPAGNPHNDFGAGLVVVLFWAVAFGIGWPVLWLLGRVAWRALAAFDERLNRSEEEKT